MHRYDRLGGLLWMALGIAVCVESIRLGPGSISAPGPGLIPLGCGLLLSLLGLALSLTRDRRDAEREEVQKALGISWRHMVLALGYLVAYALLLEVLGYLAATVLWVGANCRLGRLGWGKTALIAVLASAGSYMIFGSLLRVLLPRGICGF